jgi:hypothetical protein
MYRLLAFSFASVLSISSLCTQEYLLQKDRAASIWWTEGVYKIMQEHKTPSVRKPVQICSAKNESESFQIVLTGRQILSNVAVTFEAFQDKNGNRIDTSNLSIRLVEYVHVKNASGLQHKPGLYPDPLPAYSKPFSVNAGENFPLWVTVYVPPGTPKGNYHSVLTFRSENWGQKVPIKLHVWDFTLPASPFIRSAFGLYGNNIKKYHNLKSTDDYLKVQELYFQTFRQYRISPQEFFEGNEIKKSVTGIPWSGGTYDPDTVFEGRYSFQVNDRNYTSHLPASYSELIKIDYRKPYNIKFRVKTCREKQVYAVAIKCYDKNRQELPYDIKLKRFYGSTSWQADSLYIDPDLPFFYKDEMMIYRPFPREAVYAGIQLYAVLNDPYGLTIQEPIGATWFDNILFEDVITKENLLPQGDFEVNIHQLNVNLGFSNFDKAARKYLDEYGFTGFRYKIPELREGNFYGRKTQYFSGFVGGTPEYKKLITSYLSQIQNHLEQYGWLGKEYLYWIDEPKQEYYWFVREGMGIIKMAAPKLTTLITENNPSPEIRDVADIGCPVLAKFDHNLSKPWMDKGREMWSYLMTWPKMPHLNLFLDNPYAIDLRMWAWLSYKWNLKGMLCWCTNYWDSSGTSLEEQSVWDNPMQYFGGYNNPVGGAAELGNGDGMFFYPPNRHPEADKRAYITGPVPSIRLSVLRDGIDDYDYMKILETYVSKASPQQATLVKQAKKLLQIGNEIVTNDTIYSKDPQILLKRRSEIAEMIEIFKTKNRQ